MNSRLFEKTLRESNRDITGLKWSQLTDDAERKEALERFSNDQGIQELFGDVTMDDYEYDIEDANDQASKAGVSIDVKKLYWESGSQGWYFSNHYDPPTPNFEPVDDASGEAIINDVTYDYNQGGFKGFNTVEGEYYSDAEEGWNEFSADVQQLREEDPPKLILDRPLPGLLQAKLEAQLVAATELMRRVIEDIREASMAYPDEEWIKDCVEANDWTVPGLPGDGYDDFDDDFDDE